MSPSPKTSTKHSTPNGPKKQAPARAKAAPPDRDTVLSALFTAYETALAKGAFAPAVKALEILSKAMGLFSDKIEPGDDEGLELITGISRHHEDP